MVKVYIYIHVSVIILIRLVMSGHIVLIDFGVAKELTVAPDQARNQRNHSFDFTGLSFTGVIFIDFCAVRYDCQIAGLMSMIRLSTHVFIRGQQLSAAHRSIRLPR